MVLGLNIGNVGTTLMSIFSLTLKVVTSIVIFVPMIYVAYRLYRYMLFKHRVIVLGMVGKAGLKHEIDWGRVVNKNDGTTEFKLKSRKRKAWIVPVPKRDDFLPPDLRGASTLFLAKGGEGDSDVKWINPHKLFEGTKIEVINADDRKEYILAHTDIDRQYKKLTTFEKYRDLIVPLAFGVLFIGGMVFALIYISEMWSTTVAQAGSLGDKMTEAARIYGEELRRAGS